MNKSPQETDTFIRKNLGLVHSCANRFRGRGIEYDDLYGAGCMGLVKAVAGFDESRGLCFSTYAVPVILGEIRRLFRDGGAVKVSRGLKELSLKVTRERERFMKRHFREPTLGELAAVLDTNEEQISQALAVSVPPVSLTAEEGNGGEFDIVQDSEDEQLCDRLSLQAALENLPEHDQRLISLRYYAGKTQSQTAAALNMTQVQVSRREKKILALLREGLSTE